MTTEPEGEGQPPAGPAPGRKKGGKALTALTMLADPKIDPDKMMLEGVDTLGMKSDGTYRGPLYSVSEMAKFFFARSSHWVRWLEHEQKLNLDGQELFALRTKSGARKYDLAMVEKIAHALAANHAIEISQMRQALLLVKIQAQMNGYLD